MFFIESLWSHYGLTMDSPRKKVQEDSSRISDIIRFYVMKA